MNFLKKLFGGKDDSSALAEKPDVSLKASGLLDQAFRFIAVDVETANSDVSSICQLGLACVKNDGTITPISVLVDPETTFDSFNIDLHGIDERQVTGQANFENVIQNFRAFLDRHLLVQHSTFDRRAINAACERYSLPVPNFRWHDSVTIARHAWPELKGNGGHGLANLKTVLDLDFNHHDAGEDAKAAAMVVLLAERDLGQSFDRILTSHSRKTNNFERSLAVEGNQSGPLYGHVACFTGSLSMSRAQASTTAAGAGITVKSSVTKKTTLVIVGDQDLTVLNGHEKSSKHRRAEELIGGGQSIRILSESEFLSLVGD